MMVQACAAPAKAEAVKNVDAKAQAIVFLIFILYSPLVMSSSRTTNLPSARRNGGRRFDSPLGEIAHLAIS